MSHNVAPDRFLGVCGKQSSTIDLCHNLVCDNYSHSKLEIITKMTKKREGSTLSELEPPSTTLLSGYNGLAQVHPHYTISLICVTIYFPAIHLQYYSPFLSLLQIL
jgi:hypothetical protein